MASQKEMSRVNQCVRILRLNGSMTKIALVNKLGVSLATFDKLVLPYLKDDSMQHQVKYDTKTKLFSAVESESVNS